MFVEIVYKDEAEMLEKIKNFLSKDKEYYEIITDKDIIVGLEAKDYMTYYDNGMYNDGDVLAVKILHGEHISIIAAYEETSHAFLKCIKEIDPELYKTISDMLIDKIKNCCVSVEQDTIEVDFVTSFLRDLVITELEGNTE